MRLEPLCAFDLHYTSDFHLTRPYGNESGTGWGVGDGRVTGERTPPAVQQQILAGMTRVDYSTIRVPILAVYATPVSPESFHGCGSAADSAVRQACQELFDWTSKRLEDSKKLVRSAQSRAQIVELSGANTFVFLSNPTDVGRALVPFVEGLAR